MRIAFFTNYALKLRTLFMSYRETSAKELILDIFEKHASKPAFSIYRKGWKTFSYKETFLLGLQVAAAIKNHQLKPSDKIAIVLESCPEFSSAFFGAILMNHAVLLVDSKLGSKEIATIINHSDSKLLITGFNASKVVPDVNALLPQNLPVIFVDELPKRELSLTQMTEEIKTFDGLKSEDTAVLVYTSGTTSDPKGVMISLGSLIYNAQAIIESVVPNKNGMFLSILPLNHLLEFTGGMMAAIFVGAHVAYANSILPHEIIERFQAFKFTDMIVVPLFLTTLKKSLLREINKNKAKKIYFNTSMLLAEHIPSMKFRRFIFSPVLKKLGNLERFISGGAALDKKTQLFFSRLGIVVCQGYGLTETAPVSTVTFKGNKTMGTQGKALPGAEIKIDPATTEILIRGPHLMQGYYKEPEITAKVFTDDGWFKSGDLGYLDKDGNLFITGRMKELIVLGSGKKVYPDEVEGAIEISDNIKELIIVGAEGRCGHAENNESVCAVVVPSEEFMKLNLDRLELRQLLENEILKKAAILAVYKRPSKIFISLQDLPRTNTRKSKRTLIKKMIEEGAFQ
jgi:long-chain acyl-CoA synthetase